MELTLDFDKIYRIRSREDDLNMLIDGLVTLNDDEANEELAIINDAFDMLEEILKNAASAGLWTPPDGD